MKSKFIGIHSKRTVGSSYMLKFGYCSVIVDNMKENCVLLEKNTEASKCCMRYLPSDLKMTEKYGSLNGT